MRPVKPTAGKPWADLTAEEKGDLVFALATDGCTASQIAAMVRAPSRCAVIGALRRHEERIGKKVSRLPPRGSKKRASPAPRVANPNHPPPAAAISPPRRLKESHLRPTVMPKVGPRPVKAPVPDWMKAPVEPNDLSDITGRPSILDVTAGQCRFPTWSNQARPQATDAILCGRPVVEGASWCPSCSRRVYAARAST